MYVVKIGCPICGVVTVAPSTCLLLVYPDRTGRLGTRCPRCGLSLDRECDAELIVLFRAAWVPECGIEETGSGPPLTEDDLIAFGRAIERGDPPWTDPTTSSSLLS